MNRGEGEAEKKMAMGFEEYRASLRKGTLQVYVSGLEPEVQELPAVGAEAQARYDFSLRALGKHSHCIS